MAEQIITHDCKRQRKEKPSKKKKKQLWPNNNVINRFQGITLFNLDQSSITLKTKLETSFHFSAQSDVTINPTSERDKSHEVWHTQRPCDKILQQIHVEWRRRDYESWRCFTSEKHLQPKKTNSIPYFENCRLRTSPSAATSSLFLL